MSTATAPRRTFQVKRGPTRQSHAFLIYGTGGIGKTTLAAAAPGVIIIDLANESAHLDVARIDGVTTWEELRELVKSDALDKFQTIAIENASKAQDLCIEHIIRNVQVGRGQNAKSLKDYGFGKGEEYVAEEWRRFLSDLDRHRASGRNVVLVAHETTGKVPNPTGEDYIRYQPRLISTPNANVVMVTKEWADHVVFISYDVAAVDGKGRGSGTRTIYLTETATHLAKNRNLSEQDSIPYPKGDTTLWTLIAPRERAPEL